MLDSLKLYLDIDILDVSKDDLLILLLSMSQDDIKGYCLLDLFPVELNNACVKLSAVYYKRQKLEGFNQVSQGSRSASTSHQMPEDIKNMVASYRRIRVGG